MLALYGTGEMTAAYLDALADFGWPANDIVVVGRNHDALAALSHRYGTRSAHLGAEACMFPERAIIAVSPDALPEITRTAMTAGARRLLVEKPAALSSAELIGLASDVTQSGAIAHVAFNRRFYPSVERCRELVEEDGGAITCFFELTEIEQRVLGMMAEKRWSSSVLDRWGLANPVHVLDLVAQIAGMPAVLETHRRGKLPWHEAGATFYGNGVSVSGTALVYVATWGTAGRWRIEVTTSKRRLFLCPLENLEQQAKDSFAVLKVDLPSDPAGVKPGLTGVLQDFLSASGPRRLPDLCETAALLTVAEQIFGYA